MGDYLTPDELIELTEAKTRPAQVRWLQANGIRYLVGSRGHVRVLRAHRDAMLGLGRAEPAKGGAEPDFTVFRRAA